MEAPLLCPENSYRRSTGDVCLECSPICHKIKDLDSIQQNACAKICTKDIINSTTERNIVKSTIETTNVSWITTDTLKESDLRVVWIILIVLIIFIMIGMALLYKCRVKISKTYCNWKHDNKFSDTCRHCKIKSEQMLYSNPGNGNELAVNDEEQGLMKNNSNNINIPQEAGAVNSPLIPDDNYVTSGRGDHYSVIPQNIQGDNSNDMNENEAGNMDDTNIQNSLVSQKESKDFEPPHDIPIAQCSRGQSEYSILAIEEDNPSSTLVLPFTERQLSSAAAESSQVSELEK